MLNPEKTVHRPERLKRYDYSFGCFFVTFNTKIRGEALLCSLETRPEEPATWPARQGCGPQEKRAVGPAPLGRPTPQQGCGSQKKVFCTLTPAGKILQERIEQIDNVYGNAQVDCYVIMPDHVHLLLWLKAGLSGNRGLPRGAGPTGTSLPKIVNALKAMTTKRLGYSIWQDHYYEHIIRNEEDLQNTRQYIQNNPLKWLLEHQQ